MKTRDKHLTDSLLQLQGGFQFYSLGRTMFLRELGNPLYGGDGKEEDWPIERKWGVTWFVFTRDFDELDKLKPTLEQIDRVWKREMHQTDMVRIQDYVIAEAEKEKAAQTEAIPETRGKPEPSAAEAQNPTG